MQNVSFTAERPAELANGHSERENQDTPARPHAPSMKIEPYVSGQGGEKGIKEKESALDEIMADRLYRHKWTSLSLGGRLRGRPHPYLRQQTSAFVWYDTAEKSSILTGA